MHVVQPERLSQAIRRSQKYLLSQQLAEGFWVGELEANTTLTSEYVLFRHLIGNVDKVREQKCVRYFLSQQQADGGWSVAGKIAHRRRTPIIPSGCSRRKSPMQSCS